VIATAGSATGMWIFFRDVLNVSNPWERAGLFAVFELGILVSALRARRHRIHSGRTGVDDLTVWILAGTSGVLAASNETTWAGRGGRLALPLIAAWLFERAVSAERADRTGTRTRIHWTISPTRLLVTLGLAEGERRDVADVDRARQVARLARLAHQVHTRRWRRTAARRRYLARLAKANERLGLSSSTGLVADVQRAVALLYQAVDATHPDAVTAADPWAASIAKMQRTTPKTPATAVNPPTTRPVVTPLPTQASQPAALVATPQAPAADAEPTVDTPGPATAAGPGVGGRRTLAASQAEYRRLRSEHPSATVGEIAALMNVSERQVRNITKTLQEDPS
jgi:hypothetical protein